jgi:hypothetical protein
MLRKICGVFIMFLTAVLVVRATDASSTRSGLSAAQIVDKNVAARGGLQAWRPVQTLSLQGKMGAGGNQRETLHMPISTQIESANTLPRRRADETQLPFLMEMKRPRKVRLEVQFSGQTAVQVYDGTNGWKLRPYLNRHEVESYTEEELQKASYQEDLDGPLVDYAAKGSSVELEGSEKVEGRDTYRLKVTEKSGHTFHVWIDAETFLETKIEGQPRRLDGTDHPVEIYFRDFRTVSGLKIPFAMETRVLPVRINALNMRDTPVPPEQIVIEKVVVNPKLEDQLFSKPEIATASKNK